MAGDELPEYAEPDTESYPRRKKIKLGNAMPPSKGPKKASALKPQAPRHSSFYCPRKRGKSR